jgi:hypothetical protein
VQKHCHTGTFSEWESKDPKLCVKSLTFPVLSLDLISTDP